jgi:glycerophosphoryl diester phosphodiesterase
MALMLQCRGVWPAIGIAILMNVAADGEARPIVIAHRGASGYLPEHTLMAYAMAVEQGADFIEPDVVITKDGVLIARHENEIGGTTDVASRPEFAGRRTEKSIDGEAVTGWFAEDFTLAEVKTLRARERLPELRPDNTRFDGMFEIPTFEEILNLVRAMNERRARDAHALGRPPPRPIGVYPETKHPSYFRGIGLPLEAGLIEMLERHGYRGKDSAVLIQSFEVGNLKALRRITALALVQLIGSSGRPYDFVLTDDPRGYTDLVTRKGLAEIAAYAQAIGPSKDLLIPRNRDESLGRPTMLVADAHAAGLLVHAWTFRGENAFLPAASRSGAGPAALGDLGSELRTFLGLGIDGFFTDHPGIGVSVRDALRPGM